MGAKLVIEREVGLILNNSVGGSDVNNLVRRAKSKSPLCRAYGPLTCSLDRLSNIVHGPGFFAQ